MSTEMAFALGTAFGMFLTLVVFFVCLLWVHK